MVVGYLMVEEVEMSQATRWPSQHGPEAPSYVAEPSRQQLLILGIRENITVTAKYHFNHFHTSQALLLSSVYFLLFL